MLEVLLPLASFSAAREHSMLAFPWPMASPCPLSLSLSSPLLTHSPSAVENCVSFSMFSFLVFRFGFSFFFIFFCFLCVFLCVSRPFHCLFICIVVRSCRLFLVPGSTLALALAAAAASASASAWAQLLLSFSWLHLPGPLCPRLRWPPCRVFYFICICL